jgi:hypothetical protein
MTARDCGRYHRAVGASRRMCTGVGTCMDRRRYEGIAFGPANEVPCVTARLSVALWLAG